MNSLDRNQFNQHLAALNCFSSVDFECGDVIHTLECIDATLNSLKSINKLQLVRLREDDKSEDFRPIPSPECVDDDDTIYANYADESYSYTMPDWLKYGDPEPVEEKEEPEMPIHPNVTLRRGKSVNESYDFLRKYPFVIPSDEEVREEEDNVSMNEDSCGLCNVCPPESTGVYTTSCGHLFCTECYHDWATSNENTSIRFNCPSCDRHLPKFFYQAAIMNTWTHIEDPNPHKKTKYY